MDGKHATWRTALALCLGLLPGTLCAGDLGLGWPWHRSPDCPRSEYSVLHYWMPTLFKARAQIHPAYLDQYPPGPAEPIAPMFEVGRRRCPTLPPMPTAPYADPASYYGRTPR